MCYVAQNLRSMYCELRTVLVVKYNRYHTFNMCMPIYFQIKENAESEKSECKKIDGFGYRYDKSVA